MKNIRLYRVMIGAWMTALALVACKTPRYVPYVSPGGDFQCEIPWGWHIVTDAAGSDYSAATFLGPPEPLFYRKIPSLSVRWHRYKIPHRLPDGSYETYASAEDYERQLMRDVYGPDGKMWAGADKDLAAALARGEAMPAFTRIRLPGMPGQDAKYFVIYHDLPAPEGQSYGVIRDDQGRRAILERHAYALVPMRRGFYVLVYPATRDGFEKYGSTFNHLINSFHALTEGPGGPALETSSAKTP